MDCLLPAFSRAPGGVLTYLLGGVEVENSRYLTSGKKRPPRVVFVLGLVSLINSLTSGKTLALQGCAVSFPFPPPCELSVDRSPQVDKLARAASNARGNYMATASALYSAQEITDSPSNNLIMAEPQINSGRLLLTVT